MNNYRIFETDEFLRSVRDLDARQKAFVQLKLTQHVYPQLRVQPYFGCNVKKLKGYRPTTWRYRIGRFRIFYGIDELNRIVNILAVDDRKDVYR